MCSTENEKLKSILYENLKGLKRVDYKCLSEARNEGRALNLFNFTWQSVMTCQVPDTQSDAVLRKRYTRIYKNYINVSVHISFIM